MIRVVYEPESFRICAEGHANAGPQGQDIVCAAVSMLMYTLIASLARSGIDADVEEEPGMMLLSVTPEDFDRDYCRAIFDTVSAGLELLADKEPDHVEFIIQ